MWSSAQFHAILRCRTVHGLHKERAEIIEMWKFNMAANIIQELFQQRHQKWTYPFEYTGYHKKKK